MNLDFLRQSESIVFVTTIESVFIIVIFALYVSLTSVSTSKNVSDQHSSTF